jgi:glycosyltransferase involved in cell wall biosynthesis
MRIVIDARESGTSTGRYVDKLLEYLQKIDSTNEYVVLLHRPQLGKVSTSANFREVETHYKEFSFGEQLGFALQLYLLKADLVHFTMIQQPILYIKSSVTTMHDLTTVRFRNPSKPLINRLKLLPYIAVINIVVRRARAIITPSQFVLNDLRKFTHYTAKTAVFTHESADKITNKPEPLKALQGKKFVMYVGRPTPHKNLERLMDAYSLLLEKHPDLYLVLAGKKDALMTTHEQRAQSLGLKNVLVTGFVSEGELRWLYENCAAYVFPSLSEGFGLPGLEAMQHGAPVVSSNATCLPEVYGDAALYFDPLDTQGIADKINNVLSNSKVGDNLKNKGHQKANEYSWQRMAEQTLAIYTKALSKK